jgi:heat shock protein HslJ
MKYTMAIISLLIFPALFSYAKGANGVNDIAFSEVQGRYWNLAEVKNGSGTISINRTNIPIDIYTIKFESKRLTGVGAVNFYFGSFTIDEDESLSINRIACTRVGTLYEMKDFTEYAYFQHLERAYRWNIYDGKLELYTFDKNGDRVTLIFI